MPFQTLADRYESQAQNIYNRFAPSEDQLIVIKPDSNNIANSIGGVRRLARQLGVRTLGSNSRITDDSRALPIVSTYRDIDRITKFIRSDRGKLYLGKQALLQTGNTFENTKLLNPLSFLGNIVPFVHFKRHFNIPPAKTTGILQPGTIASITSNFDGKASFKIISKLADRVRGTFSPLRAILPRFRITAAASRPEFRAMRVGFFYSPRLYERQPISERGNPKVERTVVAKPSPTLEGKDLFTIAFSAKKKFYEDKRLIENIPIKDVNKFYSPYITDKLGYDDPNTVVKSTVSGFTGIKDPYNIPESRGVQQDAAAGGAIGSPDAFTVTGIDNESVNYSNIIKSHAAKSDIIKFTFKNVSNSINPSADPVHFRAFISSLKENIKTEFNDQRYIGRTERFVTYGGAKRGVDLRFNVVAFSRAEIDTMWARINYLSGMAFPQLVVNGFSVPPLFAFTIGGLYGNQRGYIESLDYDFIDESTTFDIDKEVPFHIAVSMKISLLESRSKYYDSPFYEIIQKPIRDVSERAAATRAAAERAAAERAAAAAERAAAAAERAAAAEDRLRKRVNTDPFRFAG